MVNNDTIVNKYLGIPYLHRGRTLEGIDCWGLILMIYKDLGHDIMDVAGDYDENWCVNNENLFSKHYAENYYKSWDKVDNPKFLDLVLLKSSKGIINHGGVVLNYGKFIHTCKAGTVITRLTHPQWKNKVAGFYRLKDDKSKIHT